MFHEAVRTGLYDSEDAVVSMPWNGSSKSCPSPREHPPGKPKPTKSAPQKPKGPLTRAELDQYMLEIGLLSQLPDTDADFDDPDDEPIAIGASLCPRPSSASAADGGLFSRRQHPRQTPCDRGRPCSFALWFRTRPLIRSTSLALLPSRFTLRLPADSIAATFPRHQAGAILGHFRRHLGQRYRVVELSTDLFTEAMLVACRRRLRAYDAVQLTVALEVQRIHQAAGAGPVIVLSSDRDLNAAAQAEGLAVDDPMARSMTSRSADTARTRVSDRRKMARYGITARVWQWEGYAVGHIIENRSAPLERDGPISSGQFSGT